MLALLLFFSCKSNNTKGELIGAPGQKWFSEKPFGMELIPSGSFVMGKSEEDMASALNAPTKTVTVKSFYMDNTEITNAEYRQYVNWVKDSIVRVKLAVLADDLGLTPEDEGIGLYAFKESDTTDMTPYEKYKFYNAPTDPENPYAGYTLNRTEDIIWNTKDYPDEYYAEVMDQLYLSEEEAYNGQRSFRVKELKYTYNWLDTDAAIAARSDNRKNYIRKEVAMVYPDTTVWIKDFAYAYNEPMHNDYFWHDAYSDYPVVGVTWKQAQAFCNWRTKLKNDDQRARGAQTVNPFRLPTEAEWEYAARGGIKGGTYPWGGPYLLGDNGCFMANFKPQRGDYASDTALYTVEAKSYAANDYNLYNMAGNVSEWTASSFDPGSYEYVSTMNPFAGDKNNPKKVIRGGSWKDVAYFLQVSTRDFEYQDTARSYVGFRTVQDFMGESGEKDRRQ
ncbi:MAG: gliding motility lipoprotein GldK [Flavobacteriaceae bacterium]|nr:gliding motility lipoprotein GldK [Flavobacteriaceae bacterium]